MTRWERWQNSETGEVYEIEWPDPVLVDVEGPQLPESTPTPIEASRAVSDGLEALPPQPHEFVTNPRKVRLMARLIRAALEGPKDAA